MNTPVVKLVGIAPELALVVTAFVVLISGAVFPDRLIRPLLAWLASAGCIVAFFLSLSAWNRIGDSGPELHLSGMIAVDRFATFSKFALAAFGLLAVWLSREWLDRQPDEGDEPVKRGRLGGTLDAEFYGLMLFAVAGMMLIVASADLILTFVALETFSIALYVLVGFRRRAPESQESAMKYFLLGAYSSCFLLLGVALAYGATGATNLYSVEPDSPSLVGFLGSAATDNLGLLVVGAGLLMVGLGFKAAVVPFHMWTPDAYQGAPSPVTGFMAAATKFAAFAAILRLFDVVLWPLRDDWRPILTALAVITMILGSLLAVVQEDVKRILAYSSIAHAGFVLTGVIATSDQGISGSLFYLSTYGLTVVGAFALVWLAGGRDLESVRLVNLRGLFYRSPLLAGAMTLFLLSLAGVPLTAGFVGKLLVFGAAIDAGFLWLVVIGMLTSAIAAFFYLRILVVMYMQEPAGEVEALPRLTPSTAIVGLAAVATLVLGLYWTPLIDLAEQATIFYG